MVPKQRQRRRIGHPGKPTRPILAPNDLWRADYKGQFKTGNGLYCYPLTVTDALSYGIVAGVHVDQHLLFFKDKYRYGI
jgi:hypothetical protein